MRLTELIYEMATLHPDRTGLGLSIYVGPEQVYGTQLPHNVPRIKIRTKFGDVPLTIPHDEVNLPEIPGSIKQRKAYLRRIPGKVLKQIQQYVVQYRVPLTQFYHQQITEPELKRLVGYQQ